MPYLPLLMGPGGPTYLVCSVRNLVCMQVQRWRGIKHLRFPITADSMMSTIPVFRFVLRYVFFLAMAQVFVCIVYYDSKDKLTVLTRKLYNRGYIYIRKILYCTNNGSVYTCTEAG